MYKTPIYRDLDDKGHEDFDWEAFFSLESRPAEEIVKQMGLDPERIFYKVREHLKEDKFRLAFTLNKMMRKLLKGREPDKPKILELGAATGVLTRWLLGRFGGVGVLVDKSRASYQAFTSMADEYKKNITYINSDIFTLETGDRFDLVCSFGLIEHFNHKKAVLDAHKNFTAPGGLIVILVPLDTPLTRTFLELHPEYNLGYRELLTEKELKEILTQNGLKVLRTESNKGYSYDFIGAMCEKS